MRYLILVLALAGCAANPSNNWARANATQQDLTKDRYECVQVMTKARHFDEETVFDACMRSKGWVPA